MRLCKDFIKVAIPTITVSQSNVTACNFWLFDKFSYIMHLWMKFNGYLLRHIELKKHTLQAASNTMVYKISFWQNPERQVITYVVEIS